MLKFAVWERRPLPVTDTTKDIFKGPLLRDGLIKNKSAPSKFVGKLKHPGNKATSSPEQTHLFYDLDGRSHIADRKKDVFALGTRLEMRLEFFFHLNAEHWALFVHLSRSRNRLVELKLRSIWLTCLTAC